MLERDFMIFPRYSLVLEICFPQATGSMCAHGFGLVKSSTHNLKKNILTIRFLLRQSGTDFYLGSLGWDLSGVFNKDVKVPLHEAELVGTFSSNIYFKLSSSMIKDYSS
jgi:hypothetical protein